MMPNTLVLQQGSLFSIETGVSIVEGSKEEITGLLSLGKCRVRNCIRIERSPPDAEIPDGLKKIIDEEGFRPISP